MPPLRYRPSIEIPSLADALIACSNRKSKRHPNALLSVPVACLVAMLSVSSGAPAAERDATTGYALKLEFEMRSQRGTQASNNNLSPAVLFGITNLSDRAAAADSRVKALEQDNQQWKTELSARESLIGELEQALASQERTITLLEKNVLQPPAPAISEPHAGSRSWGPSGWDPRRLQLADVRNFAFSPSVAERTLTVALVLLLIYVLYLRLRTDNTLPPRDYAPARRGAQSATAPSAMKSSASDQSQVNRSATQTRAEKKPAQGGRADIDLRPTNDADMPMFEPAGDLSMDTPQPPLEDAAKLPEQDPTPAAEFSQSFEQPPESESIPPTVGISPPRKPPEQSPERSPKAFPEISIDDSLHELTTTADAAMDLPASPPAAASPSPSAKPAQRKRADPATLSELDTLIAFEHFDEAAELLAEVMEDNPDNPEYRLRSFYIRAALGDYERIASEQAILKAIMDGPMSDTLGRVKNAGRALLPGHPLFQDEGEEGAEERNDNVESIPLSLPDSEASIALGDDVVDEFNELTFEPIDIEPIEIEPVDKQPKTD